MTDSGTDSGTDSDPGALITPQASDAPGTVDGDEAATTPPTAETTTLEAPHTLAPPIPPTTPDPAAQATCPHGTTRSPSEALPPDPQVDPQSGFLQAMPAASPVMAGVAPREACQRPDLPAVASFDRHTIAIHVTLLPLPAPDGVPISPTPADAATDHSSHGDPHGDQRRVLVGIRAEHDPPIVREFAGLDQLPEHLLAMMALLQDALPTLDARRAPAMSGREAVRAQGRASGNPASAGFPPSSRASNPSTSAPPRTNVRRRSAAPSATAGTATTVQDASEQTPNAPAAAPEPPDHTPDHTPDHAQSPVFGAPVRPQTTRRAAASRPVTGPTSLNQLSLFGDEQA